jgi:hypothetical protein
MSHSQELPLVEAQLTAMASTCDDSPETNSTPRANPAVGEYEARRCAICGAKYPSFGFGSPLRVLGWYYGPAASIEWNWIIDCPRDTCALRIRSSSPRSSDRLPPLATVKDERKAERVGAGCARGAPSFALALPPRYGRREGSPGQKIPRGERTHARQTTSAHACQHGH